MSSLTDSERARDHFLSECRYALTDEFLLQSHPVIVTWPSSITRALMLLGDLESFQKICRFVHKFAEVTPRGKSFVIWATREMYRSKDFRFPSVLYDEFPEHRERILNVVFRCRCGGRHYYALEHCVDDTFDVHRGLMVSPTVKDVVKGFLYFEVPGHHIEDE